MRNVAAKKFYFNFEIKIFNYIANIERIDKITKDIFIAKTISCKYIKTKGLKWGENRKDAERNALHRVLNLGQMDRFVKLQLPRYAVPLQFKVIAINPVAGKFLARNYLNKSKSYLAALASW